MSATTTFYDSAQIRPPIVTEFGNFWRRRGLIRLLVTRDLTLRYKRSVLGVWWTLLNPLLTTAVMWLVFSQVFARSGPEGVPFIVYLLSGVIFIAGFWGQGVVAAGSSLVSSRGILSRMAVPAEIFSLSAAIAALANFGVAVVLLLLIQVVVGVGIPWTVVLLPIPALAMLCLVTGIGMIVAAAAVHFFDVLEFTRVMIQLSVWMVPVFYPLEIIPDRARALITANPLHSYLEVLRGLVYEGTFAPWWNFAVMIGSALLFLTLGVWMFSRSWKNLVVAL